MKKDLSHWVLELTQVLEAISFMQKRNVLSNVVIVMSISHQIFSTVYMSQIISVKWDSGF